MKITRVKDIKSWQESRELTKRAYKLTMKGPFAQDFGLQDRIHRACSVIANVAEGFNRRTTKEFISSLRIALASAPETKSHLYVALDLGCIEASTNELYEERSKVRKLITGFTQYLGHTNE